MDALTPKESTNADAPQCERWCGKCETTGGYGFAAGALGIYEFAACGRLVAFMADIDGLDEEETINAQARDFCELTDSRHD